MAGVTDVQSITVRVDVSSLFDQWLPEERVENGRYVDVAESEQVYLALLAQALRRDYPQAEVDVAPGSLIPGTGATVAVNGLVDSDLCAEVSDLVDDLFARQEWVVWIDFGVYDAKSEGMPPDLLREAAEIVARGEGPVEMATVSLAGQPERLKVLYAPAIGRAGIAHGAEADWTDASSLEDGVRRYLSGRMEE